MSNQTNTASQLLELAINKNADIDKLEKLLALQERWDADRARKSFYEAMAQFQSNLPVIKKQKQAAFSTKSGQVTYNYASLDDIAEQIKPLLSRYGLSYRFEQRFDDARCKVICIVSHKDGHSVTCEMIGLPDNSGSKNDIQKIASTITYLRRYTLTGALGITAADDDIDGRLPESNNNDQQPQDNRHKALPVYSEDRFQEQLPQFTDAIQSGKKSATDLIAMVETRFLMSNEQKQQLASIQRGTA